MGSDSGRCFHLLQPVAEVHMGNAVLCGVVVRITLTLVSLDLEGGW
jgi:hypothetical protein